MPDRVPGPSPSLRAVAVALLIFSLLVVLGSCWFLAKTYRHAYDLNQMLLYAHDQSIAMVDISMLAQIGFGVLGIFTALGLLRLQEKARKRAIFLSTVPLGLVAFVLLIFIAGTMTGNGASSANAIFAAVLYAPFFLILLPLSAWWFFLLRGERAKSEFH
ncbi:MAG TPA: hypothetical protein VN745_11175 [Verrucomicrobiae bacterium]|nr:hypothetical protein [Verrucomicrobiae bacterium]